MGLSAEFSSLAGGRPSQLLSHTNRFVIHCSIGHLSTDTTTVISGLFLIIGKCAYECELTCFFLEQNNGISWSTLSRVQGGLVTLEV